MKSMHYTSIEEFIETMTSEEWANLMADCYVDEMAQYCSNLYGVEEGLC